MERQSRSIRSRIIAAVALMALAALVWAAPSLVRPQTASAQSYGSCPSGTYPVPNGYGGYYCTTTPTSGPTYCYPPYTSSALCPSTVGVPVTYSAGWNIVGVPASTTLGGVAGPLYTFPVGAGSYQVVPSGSSLQAGTGYWAYFGTSTTVYLPYAASSSVTVQVPPAQFTMIGNPGTTAATVTGAGVVVFAYSPNGGYTQTNQLNPGQGAWALSLTGGPVTITNAPSPYGPPPPPF